MFKYFSEIRKFIDNYIFCENHQKILLIRLVFRKSVYNTQTCFLYVFFTLWPLKYLSGSILSKVCILGYGVSWKVDKATSTDDLQLFIDNNSGKMSLRSCNIHFITFKCYTGKQC